MSHPDDLGAEEVVDPTALSMLSQTPLPSKRTLAISFAVSALCWLTLYLVVMLAPAIFCTQSDDTAHHSTIRIRKPMYVFGAPRRTSYVSQVNVYSGVSLVALVFYLNQICLLVDVAFVMYCRVECTKARD